MWTWGIALCLATPLISAIYCITVIVIRHIKFKTTMNSVFDSLTSMFLMGAIGGVSGAFIGVLIGCSIWQTTQCGFFAFFTAPIGFTIGMIVGLQISFGKGGKWVQFFRDRFGIGEK